MTPLRILLPLAILSVPVLADEPPPPNPYELFNGAVASFGASNYTAAADSFARAAEAAPSRGLSPAQALFDKGVALESAADPSAAAAFLEAARSLNAPLPLQARSYYNAGNLLLRQAMEVRSNPEMNVLSLPSTDPASPDSTSPAPPDSSKLLEASLASLQNAIELDPSNIDAKASYELAALIQQELQQQQQQQQNQDQSQDQQNQDQSSDDDQQQSQQQDQQQEQQEQQDQSQQQSQPQESQESQESQPSQDQPQSSQQQPAPSEQMTPEEATQLLDAMRAREQSQRDQLKPLFGRPIPVENDW